MNVRWLTAFIDRPEDAFDEATRFWMQVTNSGLSEFRGEAGEFVTLIPQDGDPYLRVQRVGDRPGGCHLDIHVDDPGESAARAVDLGAVEQNRLEGVVGLRSPAGLSFCLVQHHGEVSRPTPVPNASGGRTLVDQLCLDIPPQPYEEECRFWHSFTGWERVSASRPEFTILVIPGRPSLPLRFLLQRLDEGDDGQLAGAHLDVACDDRDAAAEWHESIGALVVQRREIWTEMADPSGLPYCLTRRNPDTGFLA